MFEKPENSAEFCRRAGTPPEIEARLRGEADAAALTAWQQHLASCSQCQKAVEQTLLLHSTFATYRADKFFEQLNAGWQPDLSRIAQSHNKTEHPAIAPKARFGFGTNDKNSTSVNNHSPAVLKSAKQSAPRRKKLSWSLGLVSGLIGVVALSFLLLLAVTLTATAPASLPKPSLELVWQVDGKIFGLGKPAGLALDKQGNIYVVEQNYYYVKKLDSRGQLLTRWGGAGDGNGQFINPTGIAIDSQGYVYVTDTGNQRVQKFDSNGQFITKWGQAGNAEGEFNQPWGIALDGQGAVYVVDSDNARIQKFDAQGNFLTTWGSYGLAKGQLVAPRAIAIDKQGQIYISDNKKVSIQKFGASGQFLSEWEIPVNQAGATALTLDLVFDQQNYLYVSDQSRGLIYKFTAEGKLSATLSSLTVGNLLRQPTGLAVDNQGNIVVADAATSQVLKFRQP